MQGFASKEGQTTFLPTSGYLPYLAIDLSIGRSSVGACLPWRVSASSRHRTSLVPTRECSRVWGVSAADWAVSTREPTGEGRWRRLLTDLIGVLRAWPMQDASCVQLPGLEFRGRGKFIAPWPRTATPTG